MIYRFDCVVICASVFEMVYTCLRWHFFLFIKINQQLQNLHIPMLKSHIDMVVAFTVRHLSQSVSQSVSISECQFQILVIPITSTELTSLSLFFFSQFLTGRWGQQNQRPIYIHILIQTEAVWEICVKILHFVNNWNWISKAPQSILTSGISALN